MGLFGSKTEPKRERRAGAQRAAERASRVSAIELQDWAEASVGQLAHLLASHRSYNDQNAIPEAVMVCESILGILEELQARQLTSAQ